MFSNNETILNILQISTGKHFYLLLISKGKFSVNLFNDLSYWKCINFRYKRVLHDVNVRS